MLSSLYNTYKGAARDQKKKERELTLRMEMMKHLTEADFTNLEKKATRDMDEMMVVFEDGYSPAPEFEKALTRKWCINLLVYLILKGGGQRPQVYACIKNPDAEDFNRMKTLATTSGYFTLECGVEKTVRPTWAPRLTLPKACLKYIRFHCEQVRPHIVALHPMRALGDQDGLLLDTMSAKNLKASNVTPALKAFVKRIDAEMGEKVTTMVVRSSFATLRLMQFRRKGDSSNRLSLDRYMTDLAAVMNTSVDMLKNVYLAIDDSEFVRAAANVHRFVSEEDERML